MALEIPKQKLPEFANTWCANGSSSFIGSHQLQAKGEAPGRAAQGSVKMESDAGTLEAGLTEQLSTLEASVRMSLESFTKHCRGTVTSITFTFSFLLLLSFTNFPYQAFTTISPAVHSKPQLC